MIGDGILQGKKPQQRFQGVKIEEGGEGALRPT